MLPLSHGRSYFCKDFELQAKVRGLADYMYSYTGTVTYLRSKNAQQQFQPSELVT